MSSKVKASHCLYSQTMNGVHRLSFMYFTLSRLSQGSSVMQFIRLKLKHYQTAFAKKLMSPFGLELPDLKIDSIGPVQRCFLSFPIHSKPDSPHIVLRRKVEVSVRNPLGVIYIILVILTQTSNYMSCFILLLL